MTLRDYFEQRACEGSWGSLYDGPPDARTYNFLTRRNAVSALLERGGSWARVLDVGCGTADYAPLAARHGGAYYGVDFSLGMIQVARQRAAAAGLDARALVGSGEELPYADDAFDLVLALGYIAYFRDPRRAIAEVRRVLRPGGVLIMQVAKPDLCGWIDRAVVGRIRAVVTGRRRAPAPLPDGWVNVKYAPRALDRLLGEFGFARTARAFNHFHVFPTGLRRRFPRRYIQLSEILTRGPTSWWRAFAVNYIGRYELVGDSRS